MSDQELLTYAAKAVGISLEWEYDPAKWQPMYYEGKTYHSFDPLTSDADAFRLMVKLNMFDTLRLIELRLEETRKDPTIDDCQILRRSIVRAAAEIGKGM